jgi:hypothetical protein
MSQIELKLHTQNVASQLPHLSHAVSEARDAVRIERISGCSAKIKSEPPL